MNIKMKSSRSKHELKKRKNGPTNESKKKKKKKKRSFINTLERWLNVKEMMWHDDEYDAGKDW